jgi:hypothetical protein
MTRLVGGLAGIERAARKTAVGVPGTKTGGTSETAAWLSRSEPVVAGAVGAGGTFGVSQSHRRQWQPGESVAVGEGPDFPAGGLSPQQDTFALEVEAGEQQDRFLAPGWQHDFAAGCRAAAFSFTGSGGVLADATHAQARAGATAPIAVETASKRQTNGRTRHNIGMKASYTHSIIAVNSIRPPDGPEPGRGVQSYGRSPGRSCGSATETAGV